MVSCAYINFAATLEMTLRNGRMKKYGQEQIGLATGEAADFGSWEDFLAAYLKQQKKLQATARILWSCPKICRMI